MRQNARSIMVEQPKYQHQKHESSNISIKETLKGEDKVKERNVQIKSAFSPKNSTTCEHK